MLHFVGDKGFNVLSTFHFLDGPFSYDRLSARFKNFKVNESG